ncbi:MAG: arylsulfatase [Armatimonadetes bacterium CG_4_9_14_3_um_filter_66_14]|nr:MAG: arylsulfatase [Armatimonadetes bacterium CG_4_9_14_3_um_filter_66_14]
MTPAPCQPPRLHTRRDFLKLVGAGTAGLGVASRSRGEAAPGSRPNIVLVMADDMGFSDIGCYGGEINTPNLNKLAGNGLRFTQLYNTARCCPTRASLLTGLYSHQAGVGHMVSDSGFDGYRGDLSKSCVTIAEALKPAGYGTYMCGKWHVTKFTKPEGPQENWPCQRGFDHYFGTLVGAGSYWTPNALYRDNRPVTDFPKGFYYTDAISDNAAAFIQQHHQSAPAKPLFLYVAYTCSHWPLHAPKEDVARYRGKYLKGWDALRAERHARQLEMGLVDRRWDLTPSDTGATAWDEVDAAKKDNMDLRMAVYAAQIDRMDQGLGRIVAALQQTARLDNTLFLFLADNGGCAEGGPWGFERKENGAIGEDSSFASYGLSWANASNTPFRLYKHWVHEGGIASPLVVHWPARVKARGELRSQPGHVIDLMATCVDVAEAKYPAEYSGSKITPLEGKSLVPAFDNQPLDRDALYWEHEGNKAVRRGKWKLVLKHGGEWELYDLEADRTELHDLAADQPELVKELSGRWDAWAKRCGVQPWPVKGGKQ